MASAPTAFITGITGQDGSYLCELLLAEGYAVHGLVHRPDRLAEGNLRTVLARSDLAGRLHLHAGAFEDTTHLRRLILRAAPTEIYHLAAGSSPRASLALPEAAVEGICMATLRLLEILRDLPAPPKLLFASSWAVFGAASSVPLDESTPVAPGTPFGAAKATAQQLVRIYRTAYGVPTCSAILFNHESPRRPDTFVTRKVARAAARIAAGAHERLALGALTGRRDWGWAPDYVRGLWRMLQQPQLDDFVLATGRLHSVQELVETAFGELGLHWPDHVDLDPALVTAVEEVAPCGNPARARTVLGWENTVAFPEIVRRLVAAEVDALARAAA